jgi:nucleoid-associated protein YgaU
MSAIGPFAIPILAVGAFAATLGWFGYQHMTRSSPTPAPAPVAAAANTEKAKDEAQAHRSVDRTKPSPQVSGDAGGKPSQVAVARPEGVSERTSEPTSAGSQPESSAAKGPSPTGATSVSPPASPAFDVVRVEPTGETVVAGRATPGATVELLLNGVRQSRVVADPSGLFALVPDSLPPGAHELVLQVTNGDGTKVRSPQSVTVVVASNRKDPPLVTITAPGQPAVVLSRPDAATTVASAKPDATPPARAGADASAGPVPAKPDAKPSVIAGAGSPAATTAPPPAAKPRPSIQIASVETEGTGKFLVSASAAPAAVVRLYLNETFIAPASAAADGRVSFAIERGMQPGAYKVRLDDVDPVSGQVRSRAEVPFEMPHQVAARAVPAQPVPSTQAAPAGTAGEEMAPARFAVAGEPSGTGPAQKEPETTPGRTLADISPTVVVPEINTAVVSRGDSLWAISKRTYGAGFRYTVIYGANAGQIRDPDLIYPGQLFVLPVASQERAAR